MTKISLGTGLFIKSKPSENTSGLLPSLVYDEGTGEVFKSFTNSDVITNGLTKTGRYVKLGGTLTEDTTIIGNLHSLSLTSTSFILSEGSTFSLIPDHAKDYVLTSDSYGNGVWQALPVRNLLNGLSIVDSVGLLGGELIHETTIDLNSNNFNIKGKVDPFVIGAGFNNRVYVLLEDSKGGYLAGGDFTTYNGVAVNKLARLFKDGTLDTTFNENCSGFGTTNVRTIFIQEDGCIMVGGGSANGGTDLYNTMINGVKTDVTFRGIMRLLPNGYVDTSFNETSSPFTLPLVSGVRSILVQENGNVLVGGDFTRHILRYDSTGKSDTVFNTGIGFNVSPTNGIATVWKLTEDPSGNILVGGNFLNYYNNNTKENISTFCLAKLSNLDGSIVTAFNSTEHRLLNGAVKNILVNSDGSFFIIGVFTSYNDNSYSGIVKLLNTGEIDVTFNPGLGFTEALTTSVNPSFIQKLQNNSIYVGGDFKKYNGVTVNGLVKISSTGEIETFDIGTGFNAAIDSLIIDTLGKVIIGGLFTTYNSVNWNRIVKLDGNGNMQNVSTDYTFTFKYDGSLYSEFLKNATPSTGGSFVGIDTNTGLLKLILQDGNNLSNPMTTTGDMIYGLTGGTPTRLAIGDTTNALVVTNGLPTWTALTTDYVSDVTDKRYITDKMYAKLYRESNIHDPYTYTSNSTHTINWATAAKGYISVTGYTAVTIAIMNVSVGEYSLLVYFKGNHLYVPEGWLVNGTEPTSGWYVLTFQYYDATKKVINIAPYV